MLIHENENPVYGIKRIVLHTRFHIVTKFTVLHIYMYIFKNNSQEFYIHQPLATATT